MGVARAREGCDAMPAGEGAGRRAVGEKRRSVLSERVLIFVGLACLTAVLPVFPPTYWTYVDLTSLLEEALFITVTSMTTMVCAIALALLLLARPRTRLPGLPAICAAGLVYALALALVLSVDPPADEGLPLASVALGIVFGLGAFLLTVAWLRALVCETVARASYRAIALTIPAFVLASLGLHVMVMALPEAWHAPVMVGLALVAGLVPTVVVAWGRRDEGVRVATGPGDPVGSPDPAEGGEAAEVRMSAGASQPAKGARSGAGASPSPLAPASTWLDVLSAMRTLGSPTGAGERAVSPGSPAHDHGQGKDRGCGDEDEATRRELEGGIAMRAAFYLGLPIAIFLMYFAGTYSFNMLNLPEHLGDVLAAVACLIAIVPCLVWRDASILTGSFRFWLPILGVAFLGITTLTPDRLELAAASICSVILGFACGFMLLSLLFYLVSRHMPELALPMACLLAFVEAALMMLPFYQPQLLSLGSYIPTFLILVLVVSLGFFTLSPSLLAWRELFSVTEVQPASSLEERMHDACNEVARRFVLSPRETEILQYLGRGYGPSYLATILPIKENTIRSHVRNIYGKLGVSSRGELLALIDETARSGEGGAPQR